MRLRNLFLAVLLCFLGPCTAYPAWQYDGTNDNVTMADNAALDFLGDPWSLSCWWRADSATGWPGDRGLFFRSDSGGDGELGVEVDQNAGAANFQKFNIFSNSYANALPISSNPAEPWAGNTSWTHTYFTRTSTNYVVYINNVQVISSSLNGVDPGNWTGQWEWGATGGDEWWGGGQAECAMWARELTTAERNGLAAGFSPDCYPNGRVILTPAIGQYIEIESGVAITNNGTTISAHPRIISCR